VRFGWCLGWALRCPKGRGHKDIGIQGYRDTRTHGDTHGVANEAKGETLATRPKRICLIGKSLLCVINGIG